MSIQAHDEFDKVTCNVSNSNVVHIYPAPRDYDKMVQSFQPTDVVLCGVTLSPVTIMITLLSFLNGGVSRLFLTQRHMRALNSNSKNVLIYPK